MSKIVKLLTVVNLARLHPTVNAKVKAAIKALKKAVNKCMQFKGKDYDTCIAITNYRDRLRELPRYVLLSRDLPEPLTECSRANKALKCLDKLKGPHKHDTDDWAGYYPRSRNGSSSPARKAHARAEKRKCQKTVKKALEEAKHPLF